MNPESSIGPGDSGRGGGSSRRMATQTVNSSSHVSMAPTHPRQRSIPHAVLGERETVGLYNSRDAADPTYLRRMSAKQSALRR